MAKVSTLDKPEKVSSKLTPSQKAQSPMFYPNQITPGTFHRLLNCYPVTVEAIARRKATARSTRSSTAAAKKAKRSKPDPSSSSAGDGDEVLTEQEQADRDVREFLELDERRYRGLPEIVRDRADADGGEGGYLTKEELVEVMEWKLCVSISPSSLSFLRSCLITFKTNHSNLENTAYPAPCFSA